MSDADWTKAEHDEFGHPYPSTLPPDGVRIAFFRRFEGGCSGPVYARIVGQSRRVMINDPGFPRPGSPSEWESGEVIDDGTKWSDIATVPDPAGIGDFWRVLE